ncbi:DNA sulfur modification protein DndE [Acrocarpospora phusangensis]|uniref:DNA sulfur modification protein DndE n=1 Tax=Acrocarpospora phusangensis TaxID=1070424 RepID=UPI0027DB4B80|nr:DNA sulfur modification protein DndE [Acrocarpospora phusangensis]
MDGERLAMSLDTIRLSQPAKDQLIKLKRVTGIKNWNVLCRWALAASLADPSTPLVKEIVADSNVEMTWRTFSGTFGDVYLGLLKFRCLEEGLHPTDEEVSRMLIIHVHRGIGYLAGRQELTNVGRLLSMAASAQN